MRNLWTFKVSAELWCPTWICSFWAFQDSAKLSLTPEEAGTNTLGLCCVQTPLRRHGNRAPLISGRACTCRGPGSKLLITESMDMSGFGDPWTSVWSFQRVGLFSLFSYNKVKPPYFTELTTICSRLLTEYSILAYNNFYKQIVNWFYKTANTKFLVNHLNYPDIPVLTVYSNGSQVVGCNPKLGYSPLRWMAQQF